MADYEIVEADFQQYYNLDMKRVVEPGTFKVMVGKSSRDADLLTAEFEVK